MPSRQGRQYTVTEWEHTCAVCGHVWWSVLERPTHCAAVPCRSRKWLTGERKRNTRLASVRRVGKEHVATEQEDTA